MSKKLRQIVVDFDGTIRLAEDKPNQPVIDRINQLKKKGHIVIIFTARPWSVYLKVKEWLTDHGVQHDEVCMAKPLGDVYVDNLCLSPEAFAKGRWRESTF